MTSRRAVAGSAPWPRLCSSSSSNPLLPSPSTSQPCPVQPTKFLSSWSAINASHREPTKEENLSDSTLSFNAQRLQLDLIKRGLTADLFQSNTLVNLHAKSGNLTAAHQVFDEMLHRNAVSWTCLISGYAQRGQPDEACRLFKSMVSAGFSPSKYTCGSVLSSCQASGPRCVRLGAQLHCLILKSGFSFDPIVCNALISMYGSCSLDCIASALRAFEDAPKEGLESWNSIISACSRSGEAAAAYQLFVEMLSRGLLLRPNEYTFGSLISASYSAPFACLLDQLLSQILRYGFLDDLFVGSALVSAFSRLGALETAKKTFFQMRARNAVSMNGLMVGLAKQGRGEEAMAVFREVDDRRLLNGDSLVVLLGACAAVSVPKKGREIHGFVVRTAGLGGDEVALGNALVNMYAKCTAIDEAEKVFDFMQSKDQVSWNCIISGLDQNGLFERALARFHCMRRAQVPPSNFTLISALSSCASLQVLCMGEQVHGHSIKLGLETDVSVSNALLAMYGDCGKTPTSRKLFFSMKEPDLVSWNSIIGQSADSMELFREMTRSGWHPNRVTLINILAALPVVEQGGQVHALTVKLGLAADAAVENAMLFCYARGGRIAAAEQVFAAMAERRDNLSWNSMVAGYIDNGLLTQAADLVWLMASEGKKLDGFTFATVLSGCATAGALERGMELHGFGLRTQINSDVVMDTALVDMYSKCGEIESAAKVFAFMSERNRYSWNAMITGHARHGRSAEALKLFQEMQESGDQPDDVTFVAVLSACSHGGLVEEGKHWFKAMSGRFGIEPRMEHFSCVVDLLGRAGRVEEMEEFLRKMPVQPNALVWRTVLSACCRTRDEARVELGSRAGDKLMELEPENPVNYVLLSKLFSSMERWEEVAKSRISMRAAMAKKAAGLSWVTMKDRVHSFVAGDRTHESSAEIYGELARLIQKITAVGYSPQTAGAFYDVDSEEKAQLLTHHSEKLALAFVLTCSSSLPIRIMKNLRVCGDCHLFFRCSSNVLRRKIILRDSIRFHHFADGVCSCGDYW